MPNFTQTLGALSPEFQGFTVALIMLTGGIPAIYGGQLADRFGHLWVVAFGALFYMVGSIMEAAAFQLAVFIVGRALTGIGMGLWLSNVNNYICEISPKRSRGTHTAMQQMMVPLGIMIGYFVCYGTQHISTSLSWRLPWALQAAGCLPFLLLCKTLPSSPRWLLLHHRRDEALRNITRLGISRQEADEDILRFDDDSQGNVPPHSDPDADAAEDAPEGRPQKSPSVLKLMFRSGFRARSFLAFFLLFMEGLCGIDGILYYAPILFQRAGLPETTSGFLASGVSAILMTVISIPAIVVPDKFGRRFGVIAGAAGLAVCMWIVGGLYEAGVVHDYGGARWVVIVFIFIYALWYCATWAVSGKIYASEIQPRETRAVINNIATGLNFLANWIVSFVTPIFLARSTAGAYFLFGGTCSLSALVLFVYMPETKGQSLENIDGVFERSVWESFAHSMRMPKLRRKAEGGERDLPLPVSETQEETKR
ncbi:MAG: hypothetical protein M1821_002690 [Bathelium mastoideum]|nr:MAG: hypothetical protein M1821_002690 [Bathelium mastoideum]